MIAAAAAVTAAGCSLFPGVPQPRPVPVFFGDADDIAAVRRIMVLPFDSAPGVASDVGHLRTAFLNELQKLQRFEIVPLPDGADEDAQVYQGLRQGRISTPALAELGRRYNIDAVLIGTVTGFRAYKPPHLGLRVQLLSLHTANPIWASEVFYDGADAATVEDVRHYADSYLTEQETLHGWEMILLSPDAFAAFVSHRLVSTWRDL